MERKVSLVQMIGGLVLWVETDGIKIAVTLRDEEIIQMERVLSECLPKKGAEQ